MNRFMFNGRQSSDFGIQISGSGTYNAPEPDMDTVSVPGRNGDLIFSNNRYKNITLKYPASIREKLPENIAAVKAWLMTPRGYCRLQDDYHPDEYRLAVFPGPLDVTPTDINRSGSFELSFNCKPQRYLISGDVSTELANGAVVTNPTGFPALPIIGLTGSGSGVLTVGDCVMQIYSLNNLIIDSELQDAYYGSTNLNSTVYIPEFPVLKAGDTAISWSGGISSVSIQPRWWTL